MTTEQFIKQLHHNRIKELLTIISINYHDLFKAEYIEDELAYLEEHIKYAPIAKKSQPPLLATKSPKKTQVESQSPQSQQSPINRCNARVYGPITKKIDSDSVARARKLDLETDSNRVARARKLDLETDSNSVARARKLDSAILDKIPDKFKVIDFIKLDCKQFTKRYELGSRCSNKQSLKLKSKYCALHTKHLIHGDFFTDPEAELIFHFMKENKLLR